MNLNSKYFDSIRIAPRKRHGTERPKFLRDEEARPCDWPGCKAKGTSRAPGAEAGGEPGADKYRWFCRDHIVRFNREYNFFAEMSDAEIAAHQRASRLGDRPTWSMGKGANPWGHATRQSTLYTGRGIRDPFHFFGREGSEQERHSARPRRPARPLERQALDTLGLDHDASLNEIKTRYKELVKMHHPDANGGDRSHEGRLQQVIQAYDYLRKSGFGT